MTGIVYARETALTVDDYIAVLADSALGPTRPLGDRERIERMLAGANFIVTAREDGVCIGLARCMTDFSWACYCAELAVRSSHQGRGIGTEIIRTCTTLLGDEVAFNLFSTPWSASYYESLGPKLGFKQPHAAFYIPRTRGV
jgi:GNAT superfamily N-acetyltransferase